MKTIATLRILVALSLPAFSQTPEPLPTGAPQAFAAAGIGFDSMAAPKASGWFAGGKLINDPMSSLPIYATLQVTPRSGGVTTAVGGVYARVFSSKSFWVAIEGGAGVSTFTDAVGSALQAGGVIGFRLPKNPNISLVFKPGAVKLNVGTSATPGNLDVAPVFQFGVLYRIN